MDDDVALTARLLKRKYTQAQLARICRERGLRADGNTVRSIPFPAPFASHSGCVFIFQEQLAQRYHDFLVRPSCSSIGQVGSDV